MSEYIAKVTQDGQKFISIKQELDYYRRLNEACPESDTVRIDYLRGLFSVTDYIAPPIVPLTEEQILANKNQLIEAISNSCREYVETRANSSLIIQLTLNAEGANPNQMAIDVLKWGSNIYFDAENRKAQVMAGVADDYSTLCDFSSHGEKPYTVYQLYLAGIVKNYSAGA